MKTLRLALAVIISTSIPAFAKSVDQLEQPKTEQAQIPAVKDKVLTYTIDLPPKWRVSNENIGVDFMAFAPILDIKDLFRENVNVISVPIESPISLEDFYKYNLESLKAMLEDFNLESAQDVKIDGVDAKKIIFSHTIEVINVTVIQYLFLHNNMAYVMTFTADTLGFSKIKPEFEKIAGTFKFKQ